MSKKKTFFKVAIIVALIILMFVAGYTYSKYKSTIAGSVTGNVAKWSFKASGANGVSINDIKLINTANNMSTTNNTLAPGTSGSFDIVVDATGSEVGVDYNVNVLNESGGLSHVKFFLDDGSENPTKYGSFRELADAELKGTIPVDAENKIETLSIGWEWPYEGTGTNVEKAVYDSCDVTIANQVSAYTIALQIIGQQVTPTN